MSWRKILLDNSTTTRNIRNIKSNLSDISDISDIGDTNNINYSELNNFIISQFGINLADIKTFLDDDWNDYKDNPPALILWAETITNNKLNTADNSCSDQKENSK